MDFPYRGERIPLPREALRDRWRSLNNPTTKRGSDPLLEIPGSAVEPICGSKIDALASIWANRRRGTISCFAEIVCERNKYCFAHSLREYWLTAGGKHFALRKSQVQGFWLTAGAKGFRSSVAGRRTEVVSAYKSRQENESCFSLQKPVGERKLLRLMKSRRDNESCFVL